MKGILMMALVSVIIMLGGCENGGNGNSPGGSSTGGERNPVCNAGSGSAKLQAPEFVRNLSGQTSWYASPEVVFSTYGDPNVSDSGQLIILGADGGLLHNTPLPGPGYNGNGNGAPAAPTIADLDGDGQLEIMVQTFDHGMDIFTVPGSCGNCLLWTTARGGPLRMGRPSGIE
jgi:hypothetical protein